MIVNPVENFRTNVKREYKARGWTQTELANAAEITYPNLNRILNDKAVPGLDTCDAIANALGIPLEELISENSSVLAKMA